VKIMLAVMILVASTGLAFAQADEQANPNCKGGVTADQARYDAEAAGYAPVTDLTQNKDCSWTGGTAAKGYYMIDKNGKVTAQQK
jgi:hypothetical protein